MQNFSNHDFARTIADQLVTERFNRAHGVTSYDDYLDLIDARSTAHLNTTMAERVRRTAGQQRRDARLFLDNDGGLTLAIHMKDPHRSGAIVRVEIDLPTWLDLMEMGAEGAWYYERKGRDRALGQVRSNMPMRGRLSNGKSTIARLSVGAKAGQQARTIDGNPLNLRRGNLYILRAALGDAGRKGHAKTDTCALLLRQRALRETLSGRAYGINIEGMVVAG